MGQTWFAPSTGLRTRLGWVSMAGEVIDDEPHVQSPSRTMDDWILSYVIFGEGSYRYADQTVATIESGSLTFVPPGIPHWYGTRPRQTWQELFVVFGGPLFDLLAQRGILGTAGGPALGSPRVGPQKVSPLPSATTLRAIVRSPVRSAAAAEHQVMALADWLIDTAPADPDGASSLAGVARQLAADNAAELDMHAVAAEAGLGYDTFRRRFVSEFGQPPTAYRNTARLAAVATMLQLTDLTTRELARRFGYTDEFHLSRRFRAQYGVAPSSYRRA